ncbi:ciliary rootlet coiled-coil protein 2 isoform X2 [Monodelphis domestica]|uniref:ciliary rootlet coiled-coil protein 2 isoform X2 n=1 Tax=Monodelphis domestica TaxID=13616 RepID=UPI0024E218E6|nr:ciliary rootlet coiled-coil protein 2 isoform X2 [Monodelphis domestica]
MSAEARDPGDPGEERPRLKLEAVIQKLEDTVLSPEAKREDRTLRVQGEGGQATPTPVPARIRQIVTGSLVEDPLQGLWKVPPRVSVQEENQLLQDELSRLEDLLAQTRAERDEFASKHHAVSERLDKALRVEAGQREGESSPTIWHMKRKLEEAERASQRKLQAFQEDQQHQAQLVQRLQSKVLQLKQKCGELEQQLMARTSECEHQKMMMQTKLKSAEFRLRQSEHEYSSDLEEALTRLEEEKQRSSSLAQVNALLREQLEHVRKSNERLMEEQEKMETSMSRLREELEQRELQQWKEKESSEAFLWKEPRGILVLWRHAVVLRSSFVELQAVTERGLTDMKSDLARTARRLQTACLNLNSNLRLSESKAFSSLEKQTRNSVWLEQQLRDKVREMIQLQSRWDAEKVELNSRLTELTLLGERLQEQNAQKDKTVSSLKLDVQKLESTHTGDRLESEALKDEVASLQHALNHITKLVLADAECVDLRDGRKEEPGRQPSPPPQQASPLHQEASLQAIRGALQKRHQQEQELSLQLESSQAATTMLRKQLADRQREVQAIERQLQEQRQEREELLGKLEDQRQDLEGCKSSKEMLRREKETLEAEVQDLARMAELSSLELERLRAANTDLQRQQSLLEQQQEEMSRKEGRSRKELETSQRSMKQLEEKISSLKKELLMVKEFLSQAVLEKEVLASQKEGLRCSLTQAEANSTELESLITKMRAKDTEQKDSLVKMAALTESLAQDKVNLNRLILQLEQEKNQWLEQQWQLEQEVSRLQNQIAHLDQELDHIQREKKGMDQSLQMAEEKRGNLEEEMLVLQKEKTQLHEQLIQVSCQKHTLEGQLDQSQQEIQMQADSLQQTILEKEEIANEKTRLVEQHTSLEKQNQVIVEERAALSGSGEDKKRAGDPRDQDEVGGRTTQAADGPNGRRHSAFPPETSIVSRGRHWTPEKRKGESVPGID